MQFRSPKATVGAVITHPVKGNSYILLTRRNIEPFHNYWCLPGGHIELFEGVESAIIREVKEETNLSVKPTFLNYFEENFPEKDFHYVVLFFYGVGEGELLKQDDEVKETAWVNINEAMQKELAFCHNEVLSYYNKEILKNS